MHNLGAITVTLPRPSSKPILPALCGNASLILAHSTQMNCDALTQIKAIAAKPKTFGTNRTSQTGGFRLSLKYNDK